MSASVVTRAVKIVCRTEDGAEHECVVRDGEPCIIGRGKDVAVHLDFKHMYTGKNLCCLLGTVAIAAGLANTDADRSIQDWYRRQVHDNQPYWLRESSANEFWNSFGEWQITVPIFLGAWALGSARSSGVARLRAMVVPSTSVIKTTRKSIR